jgi:tetratricopeptide (TPR) repeat protein
MIPDSSYSYYGLGVEFFEKGEYNKAIEYFFKSLEMGDHFKTYERLYNCYVKIGEHSKARECIEKAFELNRNNDKVAIEYISKLVNEGEEDELPKKLLDEVLERNPTYGPARKLKEQIELRKEHRDQIKNHS